jgi:cell wall-active antibiotic response 4TMS protein YvqF
MTRRPDLTSLVAGVVLVALGALLVLQSEDVVDLSLGYLWPALLAATGAVLLASGIRRRRRG